MLYALLHNFLWNEIHIDLLEQELDVVELLHERDDAVDFIDTIESSQAWLDWRDNLARAMFDD